MSRLSHGLEQLGISRRTQRAFVRAAGLPATDPGGQSPAPPIDTGPGSIFGITGGITLPGGYTIGAGGQITKGIEGHVTVSPGSGSGGCPSGYHLNKHALPASRSHGAVGPRAICVRNRSMNPMNGRAVARAARRIHAGEKLLRRIYQVEGKAHGKIKPRVHHRRK